MERLMRRLNGSLSRSVRRSTQDVFQQSPLDLRFALQKTLDPRVTFTRASSGTFVGSDGLIKTATTDEPRFDHNPTTGESLGLLVEEARTNLLLRSEEFETSWTPTRASVTTNAVAAPSGATTADKLVEDTTATNTHQLQQSVTLVANTTYTFSVFIKSAERTELRVLFSAGSDGINAFFNFATGVATPQANTGSGVVSSTSLVALPNGWYRATVTGLVSPTSTAGAVTLRLINATSNSYTGDGTSGLFLWGAQLEAGAFPTSYIPTITATVTRSADVASITGANFSSWYRQDEGTVFVNAINPAASTTLYAASDGTANNRIQADTGTNTRIARVVAGGTTQANNSIAYTFGTQQQFALSYVLNSINFANAGTLGTEDTSATIPTVDQLRIGANPTGANALNGTIKRLTYWPQRLPNSTLQGVTR